MFFARQRRGGRLRAANRARCSGYNQLADELARLQRAFATSPEFMDRATHLLLVARSRRAAAPEAGVAVST
jgi:hypothetical protein